MSQFAQGSWNESICWWFAIYTTVMVLKGVNFCSNFQFSFSSVGSWKDSTFAIWAMVLKWVNTTFQNSSKWSWSESNFAVYEGSWKESMCLNSLISPKWSWKESVCVATLLVALILAVLSFLYSDVVLLYLGLFCLCLGCMGTFSWAPSWTLFFCARWWSVLCPWGSPWAAWGHWGCLSADCLALYC